MEIEQVAGRFTATAFTDGAPIRTVIATVQPNGAHVVINHCTVDDLYDLQYCIDRMIGRIEAHQNNQRRASR